MTDLPYELYFPPLWLILLSIAGSALLLAVILSFTVGKSSVRSRGVQMTSIVAGYVTAFFVGFVIACFPGDGALMHQRVIGADMEAAVIQQAEELYGVTLAPEHISTIFYGAPFQEPTLGTVHQYGSVQIMHDNDPLGVTLMWAGDEWRLTHDGDELPRVSA